MWIESAGGVRPHNPRLGACCGTSMMKKGACYLLNGLSLEVGNSIQV